MNVIPCIGKDPVDCDTLTGLYEISVVVKEPVEEKVIPRLSAIPQMP